MTAPTSARTASKTASSELPATAAKSPKLNRRQREGWAAALFLAPDVIGLTIFIGLPMVLSFVLSLFQVSGFGQYTFIGFANYQRIFADPVFYSSLRTTLIYVVCLVPGGFVASLLLALLVRQKLPGVGFFRTAYFLPFSISIVVVALIWRFMLDDQVGVVNQVLGWVGIPPQSWLGNPQLALGTAVVVTIWVQMGYYMVILLGGLQDIPTEFYEAARIDGASAWANFRHITWPLLKPTSFFVLLTSTVAALTGAFDMIYVLTKGGPANSTNVLIFYIYQQAFQYGEYGYAAAIGTFLVLIMLACSTAIFVTTRGGRFSYGD
ncbi:carbohydrate ABC transporter permease [Fodinicola feengrottensis]|uniref:Sugar ABC transporter permease n=1 Tax=Fodinicola feengrottensis TaxID=435914 RepID=A0ABP4SXW8_9ACTN|nr:sugar ABC transporter permease [Fodinicola feengrottensis]